MDINMIKKLVGVSILFIGLIVFTSILNGYVLSVLWSWFIVPTFNIPSLNIPTAIGVALVVEYLTYQIKIDENDKKTSFGEKMSDRFIISILKPAFALLFGWVVTFWM
jgi:hypothetical protein